ncbi:DUF305 domain-containing protein (plasmid) [Paracoccus yeei]|uniref:DUF305 domain-containing protein n=2 Tax=Paracoccus yeei TaxID=147645 RepID=A0A5P2QKP6_9RHOB|nr:DUF305 domain-containing protein [Paracoccus yeei]
MRDAAPPEHRNKSMKRTAIALSLGLSAVLPAAALAEGEHETHHSAEQQGQVATPASPAMPMESMNGPSSLMMQGMSVECVAAMQKMMQGMMAASSPDAATPVSKDVPDFTQANILAMDAMHAPMAQGVMADDPDIAFVRGMIPHHQGAIAMARVVQQYGNDPQTKAWAAQIIEAQEREIAGMESWLSENGSSVQFDLGEADGTVYSANEGGSTISAVDLGSGTVSDVPIPVAPHNVDLTPDGRLLLAVGTPASGNDDPEGHGHDNDAAGLLVILDLQDLAKPATTVEIGAHPAHVVADRNGRAFASVSGSNEIAVVDLAQGAVLGRIGTGAYPHGLRLSPDGAELYVANVEDGSVSVIDTQSLEEAARIPVGAAPVQVGFTPDGARAYVSLRDENRVAVIDTVSRKVESKIDVGPGPIQLMATPDGAYVYVANQGSEAAPNNTVSVIDTRTGEVTKTLETGLGAHGVSVSADGAFVFVTNISDDSVSIIDAQRQEVVTTVPVGDGPNGIVYGSAR